MYIDYLKINGVKQGIIMVDNNLDKPLLIFVHGGPGCPEFILFEKKCPEIFDEFICCFPEQRGSGLSYSKDLDPDENSQIEKIVDDTIVITEYYLKKYKKEKAYIMGHSWGSAIAPLVAKKRSDLYHAYIGIGQINQPWESEKEGYEFILNKSRIYNNKKILNKLITNKPTKAYIFSDEYMKIRSSELNKYRKALWHKKKVSMGTMFAYMQTSKVYSKTYFLKFISGNMYGGKNGISKLADMHLEKQIQSLEIPMYILQGYHDLQTSFKQAQLFYQNVDAPKKKFFIFADSAHCPMLDESEKFIKSLKEILSQ